MTAKSPRQSVFSPWLRLIKALVAAVLVGGLLGGTAAMRTLPLTMSDEQILAEWALEKNRQQKDAYLMYLLSRLPEQEWRQNPPHYLPLFYPALLRLDRHQQFAGLLAKTPSEFKHTTAFRQSMLECFDILLGHGEYKRAEKILAKHISYFQENGFLAAAAKERENTLRLMQQALELAQILAEMRPKITKGTLAANDPLLDQAGDLALHAPSLSAENAKFLYRLNILPVALLSPNERTDLPTGDGFASVYDPNAPSDTGDSGLSIIRHAYRQTLAGWAEHREASLPLDQLPALLLAAAHLKKLRLVATDLAEALSQGFPAPEDPVFLNLDRAVNAAQEVPCDGWRQLAVQFPEYYTGFLSNIAETLNDLKREIDIQGYGRIADGDVIIAGGQAPQWLARQKRWRVFFTALDANQCPESF